MRNKLSSIFIVLLVLLLSACSIHSGKPEATGSSPTPGIDKTGYRIGYSCMDLDDSLNREFCDYLKSYCQEQNIELVLHDGKSDVARQIMMLQRWAGEDINAVICSPVDPTAIQSAADMCMDAGIPFINIDSECERKTAYIGVSQYDYGYAAGRIAADWINDNLADQEVVTCGILESPQSFDYIDRANGMIAGLMENCDRVKMVAHEGYMSEEEAFQAASRILDQNIFIDCFIMVSEAGLNGVYDALLATGVDTSQRCLVGLGASNSVLQLIADNTMVRGTVVQGTDQFAKLTVEVAVDAINGVFTSRTLLDIIPITISNVNQFLK